MHVEIKKLGPQDLSAFQELIRLFEDVFEMKNFQLPPAHHLQTLLAKDSFLVFVALLNNQVVGGLTAYTLTQYYSEKPLAYIYDLAVQTDLQRQGIGKMLISSITNYCRQMGMEEVFVQADAVDDYAVKFYESTGATPEKVFHFYYPLQPENSGKELNR
jgi:aminoglycoside 3-N-acetyltransferase I